MPGLLKTVLFVEDGKFDEIFKQSIMKHVLLEKSSHGKWLKALIAIRPERAIRYFTEFSKLVSDDLNGLLPFVKEVDEVMRVRRSNRRSVLTSIHHGLFGSNDSSFDDSKGEDNGYAKVMITKRDDIIHYLCYDLQILSRVAGMSEKDQLKAVSTRLIQMIVDMQTAHPFNSCVTVLDAFFHFILFAAAQVQSVVFLCPNFNAEAYVVATVVTLFSVFYFALRELLQIVSYRSWTDFEENVIFDLWNHIDLITIILLVSAFICWSVQVLIFHSKQLMSKQNEIKHTFHIFP